MPSKSHESGRTDRDERRSFSEMDLPAAEIVADLAELERAFQANLGRQSPSEPAVRCRLEKAALVRVRRNQSELTEAEQQAFCQAVQVMVDEGIYDELAQLRGDRSHNMLGSLGVRGLQRFLPWHRRYLWEFETELQRIDRRLRPGELPLALPYWDWPERFPGWLVDFFPESAAVRGDRTARRRRLTGSEKPTREDVRLILDRFDIQLPATGVSDFVKFTYGLEGWGRRPEGRPLPAHNQVHAWVGGAMGYLETAPADPIFWLHMAQVDRLWSLWQEKHPTAGPALVGADQVLDPWPETVDDVHRPLAMGYLYDR